MKLFTFLFLITTLAPSQPNPCEDETYLRLKKAYPLFLTKETRDSFDVMFKGCQEYVKNPPSPTPTASPSATPFPTAIPTATPVVILNRPMPGLQGTRENIFVQPVMPYQLKRHGTFHAVTGGITTAISMGVLVYFLIDGFQVDSVPRIHLTHFDTIPQFRWSKRHTWGITLSILTIGYGTWELTDGIYLARLKRHELYQD
jgi:hypothetical protein